MVAWNDTFSQCGVPDSDGSMSPDVIDGFDFTKRSEEVRGGCIVIFGGAGFRGLSDASPLRRFAAPLNQSDPETELYYVRNRMYNPALGRWVQRDPIGYSGGINLYGYVGGRAVVELDPEGTDGPCYKKALVCLHGCESLYEVANLLIQAILQRCLQHCKGRWLQVVCWEGCHARAEFQEGLNTAVKNICITECNVEYAACEVKKCGPKII